MYLSAFTLILIALGYFLLFDRKVRKGLLLPVLFIAVCGYALHAFSSREYKTFVESFRGNSHFGCIQILTTRDGRFRYYLNDNLIQNTYDLERKQSVSQFTFLLSGLARAYTTNIQNVLCIGLGVGIVPMDFARAGAQVDVVEINRAIVPVATRYFGLEPQRLHLTIDDGRHFLNRCRKQYDAVILDAFLGDSSPSHLLTKEAFTSVRQVLRPGGVLVINAFAEVDPGRDFFAASLNKTLKSVFPGVRLHSNNRGAIFFVGTDHPSPIFLHPPNLEEIHPYVAREAQASFDTLVETIPENGRLLTDNYNPAEFFDAHHREELRRRLALGAKEM